MGDRSPTVPIFMSRQYDPPPHKKLCELTDEEQKRLLGSGVLPEFRGDWTDGATAKHIIELGPVDCDSCGLCFYPVLPDAVAVCPNLHQIHEKTTPEGRLIHCCPECSPVVVDVDPSSWKRTTVWESFRNHFGEERMTPSPYDLSYAEPVRSRHRAGFHDQLVSHLEAAREAGVPPGLISVESFGGGFVTNPYRPERNLSDSGLWTAVTGAFQAKLDGRLGDPAVFTTETREQLEKLVKDTLLAGVVEMCDVRDHFGADFVTFRMNIDGAPKNVRFSRTSALPRLD